MELKFFFVRFLNTLLHADKIRELKQRRRQRQRERQNSYRLRLAKQQLCTCITLFCTLLFHCHVKVPNLTFYRGRKHRTTFFFFSPTLIHSFRIQLQKILPTSDEHIEQDGMSAIKFKAARTDVFWRDRHFTWSSEPREGPAACRAKEVPSFLSYFKTLSISPAPGIEPATSRSAVKRSTDWANPAAVS